MGGLVMRKAHRLVTVPLDGRMVSRVLIVHGTVFHRVIGFCLLREDWQRE
jgi:hypothetical protein